MSDDRKPIELKATKAALDAIKEQGGGIIDADLLEKVYIKGEPVFTNIETDPDTGDLISYELTPEMQEALKSRLKEAQNTLAEMAGGNSPDAKKARKALMAANLETEKVKALVKELRDLVLDSDTIKKWRVMAEQLQPIMAALDELQELTPFIKAELKKPEYNGAELDDLLEDITPADLLELPEDSTLYKAMQAARAAKAAAAYININRADIVEYPLDKPNSHIWNLLEKDTGGQIKFDLLPKKPNLQATAIYSINFDNLSKDLQITKRLTPFDKRVYIAASALFNAGNDVITLSQIYYAMGYIGKPSAYNLKKINDACTKMTGAKILFDNKEEAEALNNGYPHFKYDGPLLPFERITAIVGGQIAEGAIKLFREPPLMSFAKQRQQVTTINVKLLQSPVNKTDANLLIDDYLIERISKAKKAKGTSEKILYKTLYERANITTKKQKQRAPEKIEKYLDYYQQQKFIKKYVMQDDAIIVYFEG